MIGLHLSQYRIDAELGRGGMGIVYRATDTKLNRTVALKVLPAAALASEDDRARFFREAQAAAQLSHPNIAGVHQIDEAIPVDAAGNEVQASDGRRPFIAMEFIDGDTVAERTKTGPLALREAITIAGQVAEALKAAHAKGIVHRDIKSANVMLTPDGVAKVLDFGLAKTNQSTMLTRMGSTLGTVAYMSPEQARGHEVDGRTDLYALGTMLYEMVAGRLPFAGDYEQAVLYSILNEPPEPLTALRTGVPLELERITAKLMAKEAEYRYQTAADLIADLKALNLGGSRGSTQSLAGMTTVRVASNLVTARTALPMWVWAAFAGIGLLGFAAAWLVRPPGGDSASEAPTVHSEIFLAEERAPQALSISPDGRLLAYSDSKEGAVFVRSLETGEERRIPNTTGIIEMDFSPDGQWLLLDEQQTILRAPVNGGSPVQLISLSSNAPHSSWVDNDRILFDDASSIFMMTLSDGSVEPIVTADTANGEIRLLWGRIAPDHKHVFARIIRDPDTPRFGMYTFPEGEVVLKEDWDTVAPRYLETGHLLLLEDSDLMARPFNVAEGRFLGAPVRIAAAISETNWDLSPWGQLVYGPITSFQFSSSSAIVPTVELARGAAGAEARKLPVPAARYANLQVSPDGTRMALDVYYAGSADSDIWVIDLATGIREQLTFDDSGDEPSWSPDGDSLLVVARDMRRSSLVILAADGSGMPRVVHSDSTRLETPDWSEEANLIVFVRIAASGTRDLWFADPLSGEAVPAVENNAMLSLPRFSPNGRYFAYESDQRILVRTTDLDGSEWDISQGAGETPYWSPDGSAIYFTNGGRIYRVPVQTEGAFRRLGGPEAVLDTGSTALYYAPIPGSTDMVFVLPPAQDDLQGQIPVQLISNAPAMIKRMAPPLR